MTKINIDQLAGEMYSEYCAAVGGKAFNGDPLPTWEYFCADDLTKKKQIAAWIKVAEHAREVFLFERRLF